MARTSRLGILGGTFNPVHLGHLIMAQDALECFDLSQVIFVPCSKPPHKPASGLAPARHRLAMLEAAIGGNPHFEVSDLEIRRGGVSYTVETMRAIAAAHPGVELCFIIGADSLPELHLWKDIDALLEICRIVTIARPGIDLAQTLTDGPESDDVRVRRLRADIRAGHLVDVSSTDVRRRVAEGMSIRYLVPPAVEEYIGEHSLYRS